MAPRGRSSVVVGSTRMILLIPTKGLALETSSCGEGGQAGSLQL